MQVNLPDADIQLRKDPDGKVRLYDPLRRTWLVVTPEEWVRQHFVSFLINHRAYPASRIANEISISLNSTSKRCDTVVYAPDLTPAAIIEYKAPDVALTQRVFDQIARYNIVMKVPLLIVSNGLRHYACRIDGASCSFLPDIPTYPALVEIAQKK